MNHKKKTGGIKRKKKRAREPSIHRRFVSSVSDGFFCCCCCARPFGGSPAYQIEYFSSYLDCFRCCFCSSLFITEHRSLQQRENRTGFFSTSGFTGTFFHSKYAAVIIKVDVFFLFFCFFFCNGSWHLSVGEGPAIHAIASFIAVGVATSQLILCNHQAPMECSKVDRDERGPEAKKKAPAAVLHSTSMRLIGAQL